MNWKTVNVRDSNDKRSPQVTGCAFLSQSRVVICEQANMRVKILDTGNSYKIVDSLEFPSDARDVTVVDSKTIIVTLTDHKSLQYVDLEPKMKPGRILLLPKMPLAVEYFNGELFVACKTPRKNGTGEILVLDKEGIVKRKLVFTQKVHVCSTPLHISQLVERQRKLSYPTEILPS